MDGVRLVPYRLPELLAAIRNSGLILIAEGERKVDLLRSLGLRRDVQRVWRNLVETLV
jgi:hypothetical protein